MADDKGASVSLIDNLNTLQNAWTDFDTVLKQLPVSLAKHGFKLAVDLEHPRHQISHELHETSQQAHNTVQMMQQLQNLIQQSAVINSSLELDQVLESVIDTVIALTGAQRAYLMLREPGQEELTIRTARNMDREHLEAQRVVYSRKVVALAIQHAAPLITTNAQLDDRLIGSESIADMNLLLVLCLPLILQGQVIGVLYADSHAERGIFREEVIPLLSAFATQAAIAIKNASAFGEVKDNLAQALREVQQLRIQIDEDRVKQDVNSITESEYFQYLRSMAAKMRAKSGKGTVEEN